ncbi:unnamed protein product [Ectocarpus sp. 12 AP-2014]
MMPFRAPAEYHVVAGCMAYVYHLDSWICNRIWRICHAPALAVSRRDWRGRRRFSMYSLLGRFACCGARSCSPCLHAASLRVNLPTFSCAPCSAPHERRR